MIISTDPAGHVACCDIKTSIGQPTLTSIRPSGIVTTTWSPTGFTADPKHEFVDVYASLEDLRVKMIDLMTSNLPQEFDCDLGNVDINEDSIYLKLKNSMTISALWCKADIGKLDKAFIAIDYGPIYLKDEDYIKKTRFISIEEAIKQWNGLIKNFNLNKKLKDLT